MAVKVELARRRDTYQETKTGIGVMASLARVLDRVGPQVSLVIALTIGVACLGALEYVFLRLVW